MDMPPLSHRWTHSLAEAFEGTKGSLPCPVATQGAHLIHAPQTPALRYPPPDPTFVQALTDRLHHLALRQKIRVNMYGATFAEEWPISRTPRLLAREAAAQVIQLHEKELHLDSDSSSDEEVEDMREKIAGRFTKSEQETLGCPKTLMQLPSPLDTEDETDFASDPPPVPRLSTTQTSLKRKRSPKTPSPSKIKKISREMRAASVIIK